MSITDEESIHCIRINVVLTECSKAMYLSLGNRFPQWKKYFPLRLGLRLRPAVIAKNKKALRFIYVKSAWMEPDPKHHFNFYLKFLICVSLFLNSKALKFKTLGIQCNIA